MAEDKIDIVLSPGPSQPLQQSPDAIPRATRRELYRAAFNGKWETAKGIYAEFREYIPATITKRGDTALHIAAIGQHTFFAIQMVDLMTKEELTLTNEGGYTAFFLAAGSGNVRLCEIMLEKNEDLAMIPDIDNMLPIHVASLSGHKYVTRYLYELTRYQLNERYRVQLLVNSARADLFDIALVLVENHPDTAIGRNRDRVTALHILARKNLVSLNKFSGIKNNCRKLNSQAHQLTKHMWKQVMLLCDDSEISSLIRDPWELIFVAAEVGNVEFLRILISDYPDLIWELNRDGHTIFHTAVMHRQNEIFKFLNEFGSVKHLIFALTDKSGNNILHLAGRLGPAYRPKNLSEASSGTALEMQQELLWFMLNMHL